MTVSQPAARRSMYMFLVAGGLLCTLAALDVARAERPAFAALVGQPVPVLLTKLKDPSPTVRAQAAFAIGGTGDPARLEPLERVASSDPDAAVRKEALESLSLNWLTAKINKQPRWKALRLKLVRDPDAEVRLVAAKQLKPAAADAVAPLLTALQAEKDRRVRTAIVDALVDSKSPNVNEVLLALTKRPDKGDVEEATLLNALGKSGDARAVPFLIEAFQRGVHQAASALAETNDPRGVTVLIAAHRKGHEQALSALTDMKDPRILELLIEVLTNGKEDDVFTAVTGVATQPGSGRAVPILLTRWSKLSKDDKENALLSDEEIASYKGEPPKGPGYRITEALRGIAETDPAPCEAMKSAAPAARSYLRKILKAGCGKGQSAAVATTAPAQAAAAGAAPVSADDKAGAKSANRQGMKLYKAKDYKAAADSFRAAIALDGNLVLAHYNLACMSGLLADRRTALAELKWLAASSDPQAHDSLIKAATDADLASIIGDPEVRALLPSPKELAAVVVGVSLTGIRGRAKNGDVVAEYADGHKANLTTDGQAAEPKLAGDRRTVAWAALKPAKSGGDMIFTKIIVHRDGKQLAAIDYPGGSRGGWALRAAGKQVATCWGADRGPIHCTLYDAANGRQVETYEGDGENAQPDWVAGLD